MRERADRKGPWRQDALEPRIVLDGAGEFFAIGVTPWDAAAIVAALNRMDSAEAAGASRTTAFPRAATRARQPEP